MAKFYRRNTQNYTHTAKYGISDSEKEKYVAEMKRRLTPTSEAPFQVGDCVIWDRFKFNVSEVVWYPGIIGFDSPEWRVKGDNGVDVPAYQCRKVG